MFRAKEGLFGTDQDRSNSPGRPIQLSQGGIPYLHSLGASLPDLGVCRADITDMGSDASSAVFGDASAVHLRPGDEYIRSSSLRLGLRRRFGHRKKTQR